MTGRPDYTRRASAWATILAVVAVGGVAIGSSLTTTLAAETAARIARDQSLATDALRAALETPCPTEDSDDCYWLGGENGLGASYVTIDGISYPLP